MKKQYWIVIFVLIIALALFFISNTAKENSEKEKVIGGQKDANGCLTGAGYSWCNAKNKCIRQWEEYCTSTPAKTVTFKCDGTKSIVATFYPGDDKFVDLKLSDGTNVSLPRAMSGSGARYAKADESFVFWNKGDTAFITEGDPNVQTYSNCALTN